MSSSSDGQMQTWQLCLTADYIQAVQVTQHNSSSTTPFVRSALIEAGAPICMILQHSLDVSILALWPLSGIEANVSVCPQFSCMLLSIENKELVKSIDIY